MTFTKLTGLAEEHLVTCTVVNLLSKGLFSNLCIRYIATVFDMITVNYCFLDATYIHNVIIIFVRKK